MVRNVVETIEGIGIWGVISMAMFFLFFVSVGIWALKADKKHISHMKHLPIDGEDEQNNDDQ